jgi:hypothetical protein
MYYNNIKKYYAILAKKRKKYNTITISSKTNLAHGHDFNP